MSEQPILRFLIVNGDDFGLSPGVNRGIIVAHQRGILTSTSLMVNRPAAAAAVALARGCPGLSVGLHLEITSADPVDASIGIEQQLRRFEVLVGQAPTHLDSHHDAHLDPRVLVHVRAVAGHLGIPVRSRSPVACLTAFYGAWAGELHPEQVGVESLLGMLDTSVGPGVTELICHPGYAEPDLASSYVALREAEVETLCDPRVRDGLALRGIRLVGFRHLRALLSFFTDRDVRRAAVWHP